MGNVPKLKVPIFVALDLDDEAQALSLAKKIVCKLQTNPKDFFFGIIRKDEKIDLSVCNPPFHSSAKDAQAGTLRKIYNLNPGRTVEPILNFGGQNHELWCEGGEEKFVRDMILQSKRLSIQTVIECSTK